MKKMKLAIVGCGWFGNFHLDYLKTLENVEVVALVSTNLEKLVTTGKKVPSARHFEHYKQLLASEVELDGIVVCVPPHQHETLEIEAARKGIHLFIEKPIERSLEKAKLIQAAIEENGIIASVGYHERYNEALTRLKVAMQTEKPSLVQARWLGDIPGALWWRKQETSGGQVVEQSTHLVDVLRYLFGEVKTVFATGIQGAYNFETTVPGYDIQDGTSAILTFENGVVANLMTGCYFEAGAPPTGVSIEILGRNQKILYKWMEEVLYERKSPLAIETEGQQSVSGNILVVKDEFEEETHHVAMKTFVTAIESQNGSTIRSTYGDSVKTFEVTIAINESVASGEVIRL